MLPKLSILIPCLNEEKYIETCLHSLIQSTYPKECFEIIIIDGMSTDKTRSSVNQYLSKHPFISLHDNPKKDTPSAFNIGIQASCGEYIIILSAHADYPPDYCEKLVKSSIKLNADCTGAILKTNTFINNATSKAIVNVLSDSLGVGSRFRTGVTDIIKVDTVAFGCYRRDVFTRFGLFDERLIRNQDIEFNKRIIRGGGKIYLIPEVTCTYYARETYRDLAKNNYQNGYWNILTAYYTRTFTSLSPRHFVPLGFVITLIAPLLISWYIPLLLWISPTIALIYFIIIGKRAWAIKNQTSWIHQLFAFVVLHFSYGFGSIGGIIAVIKQFILKAFL